MQLSLVFQDDKSSKFWNIQVDGVDVQTHWGRIGTAGQKKTKTYASDEAARKAADKAVAGKRKKGYVDAEPTSSEEAPKVAPSAKAAPGVMAAPSSKKPKVAPPVASAPKRPVVHGEQRVRLAWPGPHTTRYTAGHPTTQKWSAKATAISLSHLEVGALATYVERFAKASTLWLAGKIADEDLDELKKLPELRHLKINGAALTAAGFATLASLPLDSLQVDGSNAAGLTGLKGLKSPRLRLTSVKHNEGEGEEGLVTAFGLPLQELALHLERAPLPLAAANAMAEAGTVTELSLVLPPSANGVVTRLLETPSLKDVRIEAMKMEGSVTVCGLEHLFALDITQATLASFSADSLPSLEKMRVYETSKLTLRNIPRLRALPTIGTYHVTSVDLDLSELPALEKVDGRFTKIGRVQITGAPSLLEVDFRRAGASLDPESLAALEATGARLRLEEIVPKKKKRTAPKRKLKAKEWTHPTFGFQHSAYAALVVGRLAEVEMKVSVFKELATIAESVSQERSVHLGALTPYDLSKESGVYNAADEISPVVVGQVIALSNADDGPTKVSLEAVRAALENDQVEAVYEELAGARGTTEIDEAETALYLVCAGPLASACLALGEVQALSADPPEGTQMWSGQRNDQSTHPQVVWGESLASVSNEGVGVVKIDPAKLEGDAFLITSYD